MLRKGEKIGEYILLEKCGSGSFGEVWRAEKRTRLAVTEFALKFFRPKESDFIDLECVKKEIETWQIVSGLPNIISIFEADIFDDYVYIVSEFANDGSLDKWLKNNGGKAESFEHAIEITLEILKGLESLHGRGFVHRDLKPANVLLKKGIPSLADFGISREMKTQSKTNSTAGTYEFMPPEAFQKNPSVTVHTDIWGVGIILHKLVTGNLPFPNDEIPSLITAILYDKPESMPKNVPEVISNVVEKALQKDRENRYQSAKEMKLELEQALFEVKFRTTEIKPDTLTTQSHQLIEKAVCENKLTFTEEKIQSVKTKVNNHFENNHDTNKVPATVDNSLSKFINDTFPQNTKNTLKISKMLLPAGITALSLLTIGSIIYLSSSAPSNISVSSNEIVQNVKPVQLSNNPVIIESDIPSLEKISGKKEHFRSGEICFERKDYDCAIENYTKVIKLNPKNATAYNNRGISYFYTQDYFRAIDDYSKAIEINPNNIAFYQNRVLAYDKINDTANAQSDRQKIDKFQKIKSR